MVPSRTARWMVSSHLPVSDAASLASSSVSRYACAAATSFLSKAVRAAAACPRRGAARAPWAGTIIDLIDAAGMTGTDPAQYDFSPWLAARSVWSLSRLMDDPNESPTDARTSDYWPCLTTPRSTRHVLHVMYDQMILSQIRRARRRDLTE